MQTFFYENDISINDLSKNNSCKKIKKNIVSFIIKRTLDIIFCLLALPVAIFIIFIFSVLIKLESKGPIIYKQKRTGKNGKVFTIYKLRSMHIYSENNGPQWAQPNDPRVTRIGRFIRNTRIDEIPQIINILKGDMSIVGPRPERPCFVLTFKKNNPVYKERLRVKPGLTGWAQVNGGYELTVEEKLIKDLYYIQNQCILLDIIIMVKTIRVVFCKIDAR